MGNLMSDPVRLPSGNIVDRTTILQHLKNDTSDPFTRQEMTEQDLIIEEELKVKIQDYLQN
jgi:ubiquitin conjugation factor E4 B